MLSPPALNQISAQLLPRLLAVVPLLLGNINHQHVLRFRTYSSTSIQSRYQIVYLYLQMLRLLLVIAIREWTENVSKICRKRYQTQEKFQKFISSPFEAKSKTTFDYFSPEIDRKRAEDIADYIFATGKNSKNYSESSEANLKTTFDYCSPEIDRKRAEDISDTISVPGKIPMNHSESSEASRETTFDYSTLETSQTSANNIAEYISIRKKIPNNYSEPFEAY